MKTLKTILMMMLLASVCLTSCNDDDIDLTGDAIIYAPGTTYRSVRYDIFTEEAGIAVRNNNINPNPLPLRTGTLYSEIKINNLNQGTYYLRLYFYETGNYQYNPFQVTGGEVTKITINNGEISVEV